MGNARIPTEWRSGVLGWSRWRRLGDIVLVLFVAMANGCGESCTDSGCFDSVAIRFEGESGSLANGRYEVSLVGGVASRNCGVRITEAGVAEDSCGLYLGTFGGVQTFGIQMLGRPDSVRFRLSRSESLLVDTLFAPAYVSVAPNGLDCGPVCRIAVAEVSF